MWKRPRIRKLALHRDTVRMLVADELGRIRGGAMQTCASETNNNSSCSTDLATKCGTHGSLGCPSTAC
jgi:hypothetical protein